jgi:hypothetical protein
MHTTQLRSSDRRLSVSEYFMRMPPREYWAVGTGSIVTGTDVGRGAQGTGMPHRWGAWQGAGLPGTYV